MTDMFSDDDDFEAFRDQLFDSKAEEKNEELVPMFGLYTLHSTTNKPKPRQDLFLRGLEAPSNNLDPYKDVIFEHKKPDFKSESFCGDFSFFGMNQNRFKMETPGCSREDRVAERNKLLEKVRKMKEEKEQERIEDEKEEEEEEYSEEEQENLSPKPKSPKPVQIRKTNVDTPRPALRKRTRRIVLSSDEESDSEIEDPNKTKTSPHSPRKKKISPTFS